MITCDYIIIGAGFAGIGLKHKLLGKAIIIDKDPFQYKIGESQIPDLIHADPGLFSLIPKIEKMKSYTRKLGSVFCDSYHGSHATNLPTPLGARFTFHSEREEIEKLLAKELSVEIRKETIRNIDLSKNLVVTDQNTYRFKRYLLDCSGPAMVIAKQLGLVSPIGQFEGMKAQWSYWAIDKVKHRTDSWAHWTVLNKVAADSWIWQIPLYNSSILSMGMLHRGEPLSDDDFIQYVEKRSAACYGLTSIAKNPARAIKPYMAKVHSRLHYSRRSRQCSGKNWILVGDAYCFADPVYSVGSGVAMLEAVTIANNLNKNEGKFDHQWYEKNCNALLAAVIKGIGTWYSGTAFDKKVNEKINKTILRGGFARHFRPSRITENAKQLQQETIDAFLPFLDEYPKSSKIKVYYFDSSSFVKEKNSLVIVNWDKPVRISNKVVRTVLEKYVIGKKLSYYDLYLIVDLNIRTLKDRQYFWNMIRIMELTALKKNDKEQLYYFHPEKYEMVSGELRLGEQHCHVMIKDPAAIRFFEGLRGKIFFGKELIKLAQENHDGSLPIQQQMKNFIETFHGRDIFGQNFFVSKKFMSRVAVGLHQAASQVRFG